MEWKILATCAVTYFVCNLLARIDLGPSVGYSAGSPFLGLTLGIACLIGFCAIMYLIWN